MENRRVHIALAVRELNTSIRDYSARLGVEPCCVVEGSYALWRTEGLNLSISVDPAAGGPLPHLGFEDPDTRVQSGGPVHRARRYPNVANLDEVAPRNTVDGRRFASSRKLGCSWYEAPAGRTARVEPERLRFARRGVSFAEARELIRRVETAISSA
jgi:hypothetical protein